MDETKSPVWTGLRKAALAEAVPVGLDKLEEIAARLDAGERFKEEHKRCLDEIQRLRDELERRSEGRTFIEARYVD